MVEAYLGMSLNDLKILIKQRIKEVTLEDLYSLSFFFNDEMIYLPREYKKEYSESVLNVTMNRFIALKNDENSYYGDLDKEDISIINKLLQPNDTVINNILNIIVIYTTYFLNEPIHPLGTKFPGQVSIYCDGLDYYCPVKKFHLNNKKSLCKICVAKVSEGENHDKNERSL